MQTSYSTDMSAGDDGLLYDIGFNDIVTGVVEVTMKPGVFVTKGSAEDGVKLPTAAADISDNLLVRGIVVKDMSKEVPASGVLTYSSEDVVSIVRKGRVWVYCENNWTTSDNVHVRKNTESGLTQLGAIRAGSSSTFTTVLNGAKFLNSGSAGGFAILQVDLL